MKTHTIAVLEGDGIGPEIVREAVKVLRAVEPATGARFELKYAPFGGQAWFDHGSSFPAETMAVCDASDAILKGPIGLGTEASKQIPVNEQPERGALLPLRKRYNTYANFRPVYLPPELIRFSPLRAERIPGGIDIVIIRELVGGLYFGEKKEGLSAEDGRYVTETLEYSEREIRRILMAAFEAARRRRRLLHSVHKSNVLLSSVLWNDVLDDIKKYYADVEVRSIIVDAAATALVLRPDQFDVMVMENMFGDILSDLGGGILGSLGLMPSACIGMGKSFYEPSHGSAPDIAGKGTANPYSMIGSVALMLEKSFGHDAAAARIWAAMRRVFGSGHVTADLAEPGSPDRVLGTEAFGDMVVSALAD